MLNDILLLSIIVFGICIIFGGKVENLYKFFIWLIFAPVFVGIIYCYLVQELYSAPLWMQFLSALLVPFFVAALLRGVFPKAKWLQSLQTVVFQTLIYAVTFPFRFLWRAGQFFLQRERHTQRLNPYRPVVGGRPPLQNERREAVQRRDIFD